MGRLLGWSSESLSSSSGVGCSRMLVRTFVAWRAEDECFIIRVDEGGFVEGYFYTCGTTLPLSSVFTWVRPKVVRITPYGVSVLHDREKVGSFF